MTAIRIEGNGIAATFGKTVERAPSNAPPQGNFMAYQGNRMQFGKLIMDDVDLILLDMDPADPLDFYLDRYKEQVAAGYTKISTSFQLRSYLKDYDKLNRKPAPKTQSN